MDQAGLEYEMLTDKPELEVEIVDAFKYLKIDPKSNLGWRIVLEISKPDFYASSIISSAKGKFIEETLPEDFKMKYLKEAGEYVEPEKETVNLKAPDLSKPYIKLATFEGAKGLSAQHVFVLGMQDGSLPRNPDKITDMEVCKFLVAITRTRKQCQILTTFNFAGLRQTPSKFIDWLDEDSAMVLRVDKNYWKKGGEK